MVTRWAFGMIAVLVISAAGCCGNEAQLQQTINDLEAANSTLRAKLHNCESDRAAVEASNRDLSSRLLAAETALAVRNEGRPAVQPVAQPPVAPPVQPPPRPADDFGPGTDVTTTSTTMTVNVAGDVLFDSGRAALKPTAQATLNKIAEVLKTRYSGHRIRVIGHTDSDPIKKSGWKDNMELSAARAQAVSNHLIRQGVDGRFIEVVGVANTQPRVPERTAADKARNRRVGVEVVLNQ